MSDTHSPAETGAEAGAPRRRRRRRRRRAKDATTAGDPVVLRGWIHRLPIRPEAVLAGLLTTIVFGSVLAIGSVHTPVLLVIGALCAAASALALWLRLGREPAFPLLAPMALMLLLAAFTALQLVPLPLSWLAAIAPGNADIWARALMPLGEGAPASAPVSVDPGATWIEVLRWVSYAGAFAAAAVVAASRGARFGVTVVFLSALAAAVTTVAHGLAGASEVYGLYEPSFRPKPWHVGPLLNPNNLSGYLNLGALCGLGLVLSDRSKAPRWMLAVGVAVVVGVGVTTASRGGNLVLLLAILVLAAALEIGRLQRVRPRRSAVRARWLVAGTLVFGVLLAVLAGTDQIWAELIDENVEKIQMLGWIQPMVSEFRWVGIGRGAFESVSPAFQPGRGSVAYTHAENFVMQWLVEWGVPVALMGFGAVAWFLRPKRLGVGRSSLVAGAWFGVLAVVVHNLVDLGLEIPGLALGVVVVLGSLWGADREPLREAAAPTRLGRRAARGCVVVAAVISAGSLVGAARYGWRDVGADRELLKDRFLAQPAPRSAEERRALRGDIRAAMLRHPADPYFPRLGGMLAWQERDQDPLPWLQRALERSLVNGQTHLLLAQILWSYPAKSQALLELRLAAQNDPVMALPAARLAARGATSLDELLVTVPAGEGRAASLDTLGRVVGDRAMAAECDRKAVELEPSRVGPHQRLALDVISRLASEDGCPDRARCDEQFAAHVAAIQAAQPKQSAAVRLRARRLAADDRSDEAEQLLASSCETLLDFGRCLQARAELAVKIPQPERFAAAAKDLLSANCVQQERCAATATWIGDQHVGRTEWGLAVNSYRRAVREAESEPRLLKLATAASKAGMHSQATRALERVLSLRGGKSPELEKRLARERERAVAPLIGR